MKKIINSSFALFIFLAFFLPSSHAQEFKFFHEPSDSLIADIQNNIVTVHQIYQVNETDEELILKWRIIENTIPDDWILELCDNVTCYANYPNSMVMDTISGDVKAFLKLSVNPNGDTNPAHMTFRVSEDGDDSNFKIAYFEFNPMIIDNVDTKDAASIEVFPNPCSSTLFLDNINQEDVLSLQVLNMQGQLMISTKEKSSLNVASLVPGSYILNIRTAESHFAKVFEKH